MGTTANVVTYDKPMGGDLTPDMLYRNYPCFSINKKEFRNLTRNNKLPRRVLDYIKSGDLNNTYVRYGSHLTFNTKNFFK